MSHDSASHSDDHRLTKNQRLRQLLAAPGIIRSFAPHDVFTARVLEESGIELLFLGGFGVSASTLGLPDIGLTTLTEMTEAVRRMTDRLTVPLIADGDTGHGNLHNVARTVRDFERAGASGLLLEDQVAPKRCGHFRGKQVVSTEEMLEKIKTALDVRRDADFVVVARTDARAVEGLDAAIERACRYGEAGADVCFIEAPESVEELTTIARDVPFPQLANMLPGGITPIVPADKLERLGFRIIVDPVGTLLATGHIVRQLASALLNEGRVDQFSSKMLGFDEVKQLLGLNEDSGGIR